MDGDNEDNQAPPPPPKQRSGRGEKASGPLSGEPKKRSDRLIYEWASQVQKRSYMLVEL